MGRAVVPAALPWIRQLRKFLFNFKDERAKLHNYGTVAASPCDYKSARWRAPFMYRWLNG